MQNILHTTWMAIAFLFLLPVMLSAEDGPPALHKKATGLLFIENIGQVTDQHGQSRPDIDFKVQGESGLSVFVGNGKMIYQWATVSSAVGEPETPEGAEAKLPETVEMYRMEVELVGANPEATLRKEEKQTFYERYYSVRPYLEGVIARSYQQITYKGIYLNIDWVLYFNDDGLMEHDFIVHPGGKVSDINIRYSGATDLQLHQDGSLLASTPMGTVKERTPVVFQQADRKPIAADFILKDDRLTFSVGDYTGTLVIDPTLEWGTYFGGSEIDMIHRLTTDNQNYLYATGNAKSLSNIATTGAYQTTFGGGTFISQGGDAFLARFAPDGTCTWATYYGGTGDEAGRDVSVDTAGFIYLAGSTNSETGIATTGTHQQNLGGSFDFDDAFIVKFDSMGQRVWGTYFGGENNDAYGNTLDIECDENNRIYLVGNTQSETGIATPGTFQSTKASGLSPTDGFLARFDPDGSLVWATYYGGTMDELLYDLTTDSSGAVFIAGASNSPTGIATAGTYQPNHGGDYDGFLVKFDSSGQRDWSTYFGGPGMDRLLSIAVDQAGHIYFSGVTNSTSGIATSSAHQVTFAGGLDQCLGRLNNAGQLDWSSYYGGPGNENTPGGVSVGVDGKVYLSGSSNSTTGISTPNGIHPALNGTTYDVFLACFTATGTREWGTYLGGNSVEQGYTSTTDQLGNHYFGGRTNSTFDIATTGAHQTTFGGAYDGFILKVNSCDRLPAPDSISGPIVVCEGSTQRFTIPQVIGASEYKWILPDDWTGNSTTDSLTVTIGSQSGEIQVAALNACGLGDTMALSVTVNAAPTPDITRNGNVLNVTQTFESYQWHKDGQAIAGADGPTYVLEQNGAYSVTVTNEQGCEGTSDTLLIGDVGIDELLAIRCIKVYPNPVADALSLEAPRAVQISIYSVTGQLVHQARYQKGINVISTLSWANGIYLISLKSMDGQFMGSTRIVKSTER